MGNSQQNLQIATFAAGCFWGVEETFRALPGVKEITVGYSGGTFPNPTYEDVCSHATGHAEVVQIQYDPKEISYEKLLEVFWANHNPTTRPSRSEAKPLMSPKGESLKNRQGPDVGDQYRSAIFYHTPEQKAAAENSKADLGKSGKWKAPIVTEISPAGEFYRAEEYHQKYLMKRGSNSCHI